MDPFSLPFDVTEEIFEFLNSKDIKKVSLVSKLWNRTVATSVECMRKLRIVYNNSTYKNDMESLLKSNRPYKIILIGFDGPQKRPALGEIEKNIRLILSKFANSVVILETTHDLQRPCDMPRLETFILKPPGSSLSLYYNGIVSKISNLHALAVLRSLDEKSEQLIRNAVKSMKHLKVLCVFENIFEEPGLNNHEFELEVLYVDSARNKESVVDFLRSQRLSLNDIGFLGPADYEQVKLVLTDFPNLNALTFNGNVTGSTENISPISNETIQRLHLTNPSFLPYVPFLKKLEVLIVDTIDLDVLSIVLCCKSIKIVEYEHNRCEFVTNLLASNRNLQFIRHYPRTIRFC